MWNLRLSLVLISSSLLFLANPNYGQICGVLQKGDAGSEDKFPLLDGTHVTNFEEEYINVNTTWNYTSSFTLENGCTLNACNDTNFIGNCKTFSSSSTELPTDFPNFLSASCHCQKECKCSEIKMRKSSCGRLYYNGCNICNPPYLDLSGSKSTFFNDYQAQNPTIKLRPGCTLQIFEEEDYEGDDIVMEVTNITDTWSFEGSIGSFVCDCDPSKYIPYPKPTRDSNDPPMIDVPSSVELVSRMIQGDLGRHPGLLAAMSSLKNKRSSRNAYIIMLGSTGSGKSSAINLLFDNPNVTKVGGQMSTTSNIHEFRVSVPVNELGLNNSELRIIDTPGLMDTRGLQQDALFLATLDEYLSNHEELHNKIPNIVFVFHKFSDNRFKGPGSQFVKMLRGLDSFRSKITDSTYSNVIFVLSHFCSEVKITTKKPKAKLQEFKEVIQEYSLFPKPIVIAVAENKASEQNLPLVNGYFKLPNGDFYPKNLFNHIQKVTKSSGDPIGEAVIRTAFKDSEDFVISSSTYNLVGSGNTKMMHYLNIMTYVVFNIEDTEVSRELDKSHQIMNKTLKSKYSDALPYLQKALSLQNIRKISEIPKTTLGVLQLFTSLKQNEAILFLLENSFNLKPPVYPHNVVAGYSFNVFKDSPLAKSPFKLGEYTNSDIGYLFPSAMTCNVDKGVKDFVKFYKTRKEYVEHLLKSFEMEGTIPLDRFKGEIKPGFNIQSERFNETSCSITAVREIRTFQLVLNDKPVLTDEFKSNLIALPAYNSSDQQNVHVWTDFFENYGTHAVQSVYGGGAIEISLRSTKQCDMASISQALFHVIQFAEDLVSVQGNSSNTLLFAQEGIKHELKFRGGDQKYHTTDLTKMTLDDASALLNNWKDSLKLSPIILTSEIKIVPISDVAKKVGQKQNITAEIKRASGLYFNAQLSYKPILKNGQNEPDRDNIQAPSQNSKGFDKILTLMMKQIDDSNKRVEMMMEKFQEDRRAQEERREADRRAQREWEQEQVRMNNEWRIQEAKMRIEAEKSRKEAMTRIRTDQLQSEREWRAEERTRHASIETAWVEAERKRQETLENTEKERKENEKVWKAEESRRQAAIDSAKAASDAKMYDMMNAINNRTATTNSCLKKGTQILMADKKTKSVEDLQVGDIVLDHELNPSRVVGLSYEFLRSQTFYGFDNKTFFFTDSHIMAGPSELYKGNVQFLVKDLPRLFSQNPLMEYIDAKEMKFGENFQIIQLNNSSDSVNNSTVRLYKEPLVHSIDELIYFLQVDSPLGTYFANGYACRHEIPPLEKWPNTMALLFSVFNHESMRAFADVPYTMDSVEKIDQITLELQDKVLSSLKECQEQNKNGKLSKLSFEIDDEQMVLSGIFNNPTVGAMATNLYGSTGKMLSKYLDNESGVLESSQEKVGNMQHFLYQIISDQLSLSVNKHFPGLLIP